MVRHLSDGLRIALGVAGGILAGAWRREHADRGVTLHQADCLIAAAAVDHLIGESPLCSGSQ